MRKTIIAAVVLLLGLTATPARADTAAVDDTLTRIVSTDGLAGGVAVVRDGANLTCRVIDRRPRCSCRFQGGRHADGATIREIGVRLANTNSLWAQRPAPGHLDNQEDQT